MSSKRISAAEALKRLKDGGKMEGLTIDFKGAKVKTLDAFKLGKAGVRVPEEVIIYDDADVANDPEFDNYEWKRTDIDPCSHPIAPSGKLKFIKNKTSMTEVKLNKVEEQIKNTINSQGETKRSDLQTLHRLTLQVSPSCKLWFLDGKNSEGKIVSNPNIGYGLRTIQYADGTTKDFYQIGLSANTLGISVYILGIEDKKYLAETYGKELGKASVTGYCIKFKTLKDINIEILETAILHDMVSRLVSNEAGNSEQLLAVHTAEQPALKPNARRQANVCVRECGIKKKKN